jgi:broad specificity phosphatase PhoE
MPRLELILVRHGETDWNKEGFFRGHEDVKLNAVGIAQADAVAEALKGKVFDAIYSSPLKRAVVTARRIAMPHEIAVREKTDFLDINYGTWQGKQEDAVKAMHPKLYEQWTTDPWKVRFPGGEKVKKTWRRVISGLREILFMHGTGCVVIVSHRIPIKFMTTYLLKQPRKEFYKVVHDPCAISIFEIDDRSSCKPVVLNDSSHLASLGLGKQRDF